MEGRWRVAAWAGMVVVVVLGLLTETQAKEEPMVKSFWTPQKDVTFNLQDIFRNPAEKASKNLYQLLTGSKDTRAGMESVVGVYLPSLDPRIVKNFRCIADVLAIIQIISSPNLTKLTVDEGKMWPYTLADSWGKVPDGLLYGNIMLWGMQEECTMIKVDSHFPADVTFPPINSTFRGHYCLVSVSKVKDSKMTKGDPDMWEDIFMQPEVRVGVAMTNPGVPPLFSYGTCMPSTCTPHDLQESINSFLKPVGKQAVHVDCHTEDEVNVYNAGDIFFISLLTVLGVVMLVAAIVDFCINYFDNHELRQGPLKFLLVFSAYSNLKNTFAIKIKEHPDVITCLHGLRVFTMAWVVWGHGYMMQAPVTNNLVHYKELSDGFLNQIIVNASYSVDTFLFMSGLLVAYGVLLEKEKAHRINWIMYYVHRFFRLSPPIMFTAAACATVFRFAMVGPYAQHVERGIVQGCRENWWTDSFFLGNFVGGTGTVCLPQCWYTAVDFQLFAVAPLVLMPLLTRNKLGLVWLALVTLASVAVPMINIAVYDLLPPGLFFVSSEHHPKAAVDLYTTPWARASTYLVGIWTGWLLIQVRGKNLKIHPAAVVVGWVVSAAIALAVLFGMTKYNVLTFKDPIYVSEAISILYGGLSRMAWGVSLMWVVFACHTGYGGSVNSILSHPSLQPLSRLTYSLFLITIPVQIIYMGAIYLPLYVNHLNKIIETCGYLFMGGLVGIPLTLAVERPILGLEKILIPRKGRTVTEQKEEEDKKVE